MTLDDFAQGLPPEAIIQRVFECNRQSLVETEKVLNHKTLIAVARRMHRASHVIFLGLGESGRVSETAAQRLTTLGYTALAVADPYDLVPSLPVVIAWHKSLKPTRRASAFTGVCLAAVKEETRLSVH